MATVDLPHGTLHYHEAGRGPPIVFLHGYLMGANLWGPVVYLLNHEFRCIGPELPFGAHPTPMAADADLTTAGLGRLVGDFLSAIVNSLPRTGLLPVPPSVGWSQPTMRRTAAKANIRQSRTDSQPSKRR